MAIALATLKLLRKSMLCCILNLTEPLCYFTDCYVLSKCTFGVEIPLNSFVAFAIFFVKHYISPKLLYCHMHIYAVEVLALMCT